LAGRNTVPKFPARYSERFFVFPIALKLEACINFLRFMFDIQKICAVFLQKKKTKFQLMLNIVEKT
jgi:hypothetical protein